MSTDPAVPSREAMEIIREEEQLLARAQSVLRAHRPRAAGADGLRSIADLRALREEAMAASEDDMPALLLEMSVRQKLLERPVEVPLPDPASPYLAHLAIRDDRGLRHYLLGKGSFIDAAAGVRIVDWRVAPVARVFYRCREGEEFEETFPGRTIEGTVVARRVVVIEEGTLARIVGDDLVLERLPDGRWTSASPAAWSFASGGAGSAARPGMLGTGVGLAGRARPAEVTALLDAQQFAAVTAPADHPLVVLGSAGSGKTTVALHRLARIAAAEPARYPLDRMAVVVPEEGLARLSARLLEPLAHGEVKVSTLDRFFHDLARRVFGKQALPRCVEAPGLVAGLKRSPALHDALHARFAGKLKPGTSLKRLLAKLAELFTDRPFLEGVVAASSGTLSRAAVEETVEHTRFQIAEPVERMLEAIVVPEMKEAVDGRPIAEGTPDELAGTIDLEDLPILVCLRAWNGGLAEEKIAHLVLDEAEDFSLFELFVLGKLLGTPRSVTLAGDEAQQTSPSFAGWERAQRILGVHDAGTCRLAVSYRCPRPVAELAHHILGPLAPAEPAQAARDGAPVGFFAFPDEPRAHLFLAGALRDLAEREPRASVAVIARDAAAAQRFHELVADTGARLVLSGEFTFEPGVDVTDVDSVKGLEFDYVVVPDATAEAYPATDAARRRLHVAVTRASHQLWVVSGGAPSPLYGTTPEG
jgi:DNA helicase IV